MSNLRKCHLVVVQVIGAARPDFTESRNNVGGHLRGIVIG